MKIVQKNHSVQFLLPFRQKMVINEKNMILLFVKIRQEGGQKTLYFTITAAFT